MSDSSSHSLPSQGYELKFRKDLQLSGVTTPSPPSLPQGGGREDAEDTRKTDLDKANKKLEDMENSLRFFQERVNELEGQVKKGVTKRKNEEEFMSKELQEESNKRLQTYEVMVAQMKERLECPVCLDLPKVGPVPMCLNGHFICRGCKVKINNEGLHNCLTCEAPLGESKSLLASILIESVEHECDFKDCTMSVYFQDYKEHQEHCKFRLVVCDFNDCEQVMQFRDLKMHQEQCEHRPVSCVHTGCQETVTFKEYNTHNLQCQYRPGWCEFRGCFKMVQFRDLKRHQDQCVWRPHNCNFKGCEDIVPYLQLHTHQSRCQFRLQPCGLKDCEQLVPFLEHQQHMEQCRFRLVRCPGGKCEEMVSLNSVCAHTSTCQSFSLGAWLDSEQGVDRFMEENDLKNEGKLMWATRMISWDKQVFFFRMGKLENTFYLEVVMRASAEECEMYTAEIAILHVKTKQPVFKISYNPRPITRQEWGDFCMTVPQEALAKFWSYEEEDKQFKFKVAVKINKLEV